MNGSRSIESRGGFTLVEVMVTLLIMAGIMITITQVLTGVRKTRDEIHNIRERQLAGPAILQRLERDFRALFIYDRERRFLLRIRDRVQSGMDADTIDFVCTEDGLMGFQESAGEPTLHADVNEVGYHLRPRPEDDDFLEIYRREDFGIDDEPFQGGRFALLHDRVKGFNVEVFEEDGPEAEPVDAWDGEEDEEFVGLPTRIEIELTMEMAPRLVREQLVIDTRTISYRRIIRFPEILRDAMNLEPRPKIPDIQPPQVDAGNPDRGGGAGTGTETGPGTGTGTTTGAGGGGGGNPFADEGR